MYFIPYMPVVIKKQRGFWSSTLQSEPREVLALFKRNCRVVIKSKTYRSWNYTIAITLDHEFWIYYKPEKYSWRCSWNHLTWMQKGKETTVGSQGELWPFAEVADLKYLNNVTIWNAHPWKKWFFFFALKKPCSARFFCFGVQKASSLAEKKNVHISYLRVGI